MNDALPPPMSPPYCDLRGYDYMPLFGHRLFTSSLYTSSTGDEFRTAVRLWWSAWQQKPAGSLPDNDHELAMLADYGRDLKGWLRVRETVLRGFVLCADGRLYHPMLCEEAVKAYEFRIRKDEKRRQDRERLAAWRDTKKKRDEGPPGNTGGSGGNKTEDDVDVTPNATAAETHAEAQPETRSETHDVATDETHDETRFTDATETRFETPNVEVDNTTQYKTGERKEGRKHVRQNDVPLEAAVAVWNDVCRELPTVTKLTDARRRAFGARFKTEFHSSIDEWRSYCATIAASDFLTRGGKSAEWSASFDWAINPANMTKVLEGNYRNRGDAKPKRSAGRMDYIVRAFKTGASDNDFLDITPTNGITIQ